MRAHLLHTIAAGLLRRLHPAQARRRSLLARTWRLIATDRQHRPALDWHRLESDLAAALRSAGADLPPVPPRMAP